jgi:hypothetical protein
MVPRFIHDRKSDVASSATQWTPRAGERFTHTLVIGLLTGSSRQSRPTARCAPVLWGAARRRRIPCAHDMRPGSRFGSSHGEAYLDGSEILSQRIRHPRKRCLPPASQREQGPQATAWRTRSYAASCRRAHSSGISRRVVRLAA